MSEVEIEQMLKVLLEKAAVRIARLQRKLQAALAAENAIGEALTVYRNHKLSLLE